MAPIRRIQPAVFALFLVALAAPAEAANILFPATFESDPTDSQNNVLREKGRKGLMFRFKYFDDDGVTEIPGGFPLNLAAANASIKIGANPPQNCPAGLNPAASACSFRLADGPTVGNGLDYFEVLYNGDLPASTSIVFSVGGVVSAMGETQNPNPASLTFTTGAAAPRAPVNVELVFDKSGSMDWPAVPLGATTRFVALRTASQAFLNVLADHAFVGDKVGLVTFNDTAGVVTALTAAHDASFTNAVQGQINLIARGGSTSIGDGLHEANASGFGGDPGAKRVVLFSDGDQNNDRCVRFAGSTLELVTGAGCPPGAGGADTDYPPEIRVCPVTAGNMFATGFALQQKIADERCSSRNAHIQGANDTFVVADLRTFFTQLAADILIGDKLEPVRDVRGNIPPGGSAVEPFLANPGDVALSILLGWGGRSASTDGHGPQMRLEAPDGSSIDLAGRTRFGNGMSFTTLPLPVIRGGATVSTPGEWKIHLGADNLPAGIDYHVIVLLDNTSLSTTFTTPVSDPGTGEPIPVRVDLKEKGVAVTGGTVKAFVAGPREGVGDIVSSPFDGNAPPPAQDPGANGGAHGKLLALQGDAAFAARFGGRSLPSVTLSDDGSAASGDDTAGDGVYSGRFLGADEEGHYHFTFGVEANAPDNGPYQRTYRLSVFARPKPDPSRTVFEVVSLTPDASGSVVVLRARPQDRFGNLLGPGYLGSLSIGVAGGTPVAPLQDRLDGSYEASFRIPAGSNPDVTLEVLGETVIDCPLGDLKGGPLAPGGGGKWRLSLHLGLTDPQGDIAQVADEGLSFGVDLERVLSAHWSAELYLGQDRFDSKFAGLDDASLEVLALRAHWFPTSGAWRPSLFAGAGIFRDPEDDTHGGFELGAALERRITSKLGLELSYAWKSVSGGDAEYATLQAGARIDL